MTTAPSLTALTYNVHRWIGVDKRINVTRTFRLLRELDADIVGLQEVTLPCFCEGFCAEDYLRGCMGYEMITGPNILRTDTSYGNALLTRHPVKSMGQVDLTVDRREPRGALFVNLDLHGTETRVIVTHLGLQPLERNRQVARLFEASLDQWSGRTILMGDFNEWIPRAFSLRRLARHFGAVPAPRTFPSRFPLFALDRIWVRPRQALVHVWVPRTNLAQTASDHLPVLGRITLADTG
jgi:endonuclease/exonuclease/phosphatase family metal-dependent hydrolase